ncbi:MAG: gamma-glutamyltranspeptidase [Frankiales bacterium]|nr:gamma-glutamyltranspeptidase [Frankiales bacterium]
MDSTFSDNGMVCSVDALASSAGVEVMRQGGNAVDAAIATSAVLTVTTQHLCGLGGDLLALVSQDGGPPLALNSSGRAGSGADPERLRAEGHTSMPFTGDIRAVPVPGCVDGWLALHRRLGRLPIADVLAPAIAHAEDGFTPSTTLAAAVARFPDHPGMAQFQTDPVRRPGVARTLRAIAEQGRAGFYLGEFGEGLLALGNGEYVRADLERDQADWVAPLSLQAFGRVLHTIPPNSQGYLTLAGAWIADQVGLPVDTSDPTWAHLTIEAARLAAFDRVEVLHENADGSALLDVDRLRGRAARVDRDRAAVLGESYRDGGTIHLTTVDADRMGVSLIQSNAAGFGSMLVEPATGIFLQNRGLGFSLKAGHPAEYGPRRRPPHTLAPALVTHDDLSLDTVIGTMGGDTQPQILLQLLARLLVSGESAGAAMAAPRWGLSNGGGFDTWDQHGEVMVLLEQGAPASWEPDLSARGHRVETVTAGHGFGHAQLIRVVGDRLEGASDPRALPGSALGY